MVNKTFFGTPNFDGGSHKDNCLDIRDFRFIIFYVCPQSGPKFPSFSFLRFTRGEVHIVMVTSIISQDCYNFIFNISLYTFKVEPFGPINLCRLFTNLSLFLQSEAIFIISQAISSSNTLTAYKSSKYILCSPLNENLNLLAPFKFLILFLYTLYIKIKTEKVTGPNKVLWLLGRRTLVLIILCIKFQSSSHSNQVIKIL